jgi:Bacterial conjugation TrbI-like protein
MQVISKIALSAALLALSAMGFAQGSTAPGQPASQAPAAAQQPSSAQPQPPAGAQNSAADQAGSAKRIAPGSIIPVELTKTVDAKKAKQGDEVVAKVPEDLKSNSGQVVVPKDTRVIGHVTEVQARNKEQKESELGIVFNRAVMKDGTEMQMPMSIQAIIGQQNNNNNQQAGASTAQPNESTAGMPNPNAAGSRGGMGGSGAPANNPPAGDNSSQASNGPSKRPQITSQTEGVIGISNLKLESTAPNGTQGSLVTSEKNNVKLESGTMMLLKVNQ